MVPDAPGGTLIPPVVSECALAKSSTEYRLGENKGVRLGSTVGA
jgi:hypothetical protein